MNHCYLRSSLPSNFFGLPTRRLLRRAPVVTSVMSIPQVKLPAAQATGPRFLEIPQSNLIESTEKTIVLPRNRMQIGFSFQEY